MSSKNSYGGFFIRALTGFTIFLFLGLLTINLAYSDTNYKVNIDAVKHYRSIENPNQYKFYKFTIPEKTWDTIKKVHEMTAYFEDNHYVLSVNCSVLEEPCNFDGYLESVIASSGDFWIDLDQMMHNPNDNPIQYTITKVPEYMSCNIESDKLECRNYGDFSGKDGLIIQAEDLQWNLKSSATFDLYVMQNVVLPEFNENILTKSGDQGSTIIISLNDYINNPNNVSFNLSVKSQPSHGNCTIAYPQNVVTCSFASNYFGSDSAIFLISESSSILTINFTLNETNHIPILEESKLTNGKILVSMSGSNSKTINLKEYIYDPDLTKNYSYSIQGTQNVATCNIVGDNLTCAPKLAGEANIIVKVNDGSFTLELPIHISVVNYNTIPILKEINLVNGHIQVDIEDGQTTTVNLKDYVTDPDTVKNYTYNFVTNVNNATCSIDGDNLACKGKLNGQETMTIKLTDAEYTLNLPVSVTVVEHNEPPTVVNMSNLPKGITVFNVSPTFEMTLSDYFDDIDNPIYPGDEVPGLPLIYGMHKINGSANITCVPKDEVDAYNVLVCTVTGDSAYADVRFFAFDGLSTIEVSKLFRVAIVDKDDFDVSITGPTKVLNNNSFDMSYNLRIANTNLNFELYKVPVSFYKETSSQLDARFYNEDGSLDGDYLYTDLSLTNDFTRKIKVLTPEASTVKTYTITPKLDGVYDYPVTTITSIPYNATYLKDYFSVVGYIPGHRNDGKDTYVPNGVKVVVPFKVYNNLDVPITLYGCNAEQSGQLYKKNTTIYDSVTNNVFCDNITLQPGETEKQVVVSDKIAQGASSTLAPTYFLDLNPTLSNGKSFYIYINNSNTLINYNSNFVLNINEYTPTKFVATVLAPVSGSTLVKNNPNVNLNIRYNNEFAFSLVDVNLCADVWYNTGNPTPNMSFENEYLKINGNPCTVLNFDYYLSGTTTNNTSTATFSLATKDKSFDSTNWPRIGVGGAYPLDGVLYNLGGVKLSIQ